MRRSNGQASPEASVLVKDCVREAALGTCCPERTERVAWLKRKVGMIGWRKIPVVRLNAAFSNENFPSVKLLTSIKQLKVRGKGMLIVLAYPRRPRLRAFRDLYSFVHSVQFESLVRRGCRFGTNNSQGSSSDTVTEPESYLVQYLFALAVCGLQRGFPRKLL